ncbi:MAG: Smr/MutS family protein [Thermodesulfobacteriota bacterium]
MKKEEGGGFNSPFAALAGMKFRKARPGAKREHSEKPEVPVRPAEAARVPEGDDDALFAVWMKGVNPISRDPSTVESRIPGVREAAEPKPSILEDPDDQVVAALEDLVSGGSGFVVSQTDEYVEGVGYGMPASLASRLHQGEFSIQAHLDLHALSVETAEEQFNSFLKDSLNANRRGVCVVHGRGLSSPGEPVLKARVLAWLTRGPWRKWVIAFCSAPACDGAAGATYVLLRNRPVTHGRRKKQKSSR